MWRELGLWLSDNLVALAALVVAAWAHWRVARTDRVVLRVEHECEIRRAAVGPNRGTVTGTDHHVRVTNRGRHPTEIDRVWLSAHGPDGEYVRHDVHLIGAAEVTVGPVRAAFRRDGGSTTRKVSPGGTWTCRIGDELVRKVDDEFAAVYIIVRDVVTDTEWRGRYRTRADRKLGSRT